VPLQSRSAFLSALCHLHPTWNRGATNNTVNPKIFTDFEKPLLYGLYRLNALIPDVDKVMTPPASLQLYGDCQTFQGRSGELVIFCASLGQPVEIAW
jgi:hypothetical protein